MSNANTNDSTQPYGLGAMAGSVTWMHCGECATKDHCAEIGGCEKELTMVGEVVITASRYWCAFCGKFGDHQSGWCPALFGSQNVESIHPESKP